jgi:hypothetical protein
VALTDGDFEQLYGHLPTRRAIEKALIEARRPIPLPRLQSRSVSPLKMLLSALRLAPPEMESPAVPETAPPVPPALPPTPTQFAPRPAAPEPAASLPRLPASELRIAVAFGQYVVAEGEVVYLAKDKNYLKTRVLAWLDAL